jgi:hypothetical protein
MMASQWIADEVRPWLFADPEKAEAFARNFAQWKTNSTKLSAKNPSDDARQLNATSGQLTDSFIVARGDDVVRIYLTASATCSAACGLLR